MASPCAGARIKIVGICGSIRRASFTRKALTVALEGARKNGCETELIDLTDYNLQQCDGLDNQSQWASQSKGLADLRNKVAEAQGIILATPEYHGSLSGVLKNALDLMGTDHFGSKMMGLVGVSGGAQGGVHAVAALRTIGRSLHAWVIPQEVCVPTVWKFFDGEGNCTDEGTKKRLLQVGENVAKFSRLHSDKAYSAFLNSFADGVSNPATGCTARAPSEGGMET